MPIRPSPLLKNYVLMRWCCGVHGYYETGTLIHLRVSSCPECGQPTELVEFCEGQTARALPFVTRPRMSQEPDAGGWQVTNHTGVTSRPKSDDASRRRAGKKATGRPRRDREPAEPTTHYTLEDLDDD